MAKIPAEKICISVITEAELRYGLAGLPEATKLRALVESFLRLTGILPWNSAAAVHYGALRAGLQAAGTPMANSDLMIAAHALAVDATLVTNDAAFARIAKLRTVDWTKQ